MFIILLVLYITYRFCKMSSNSDNQKIEDELFIKTYGHEKIFGDCERSGSNKSTKLGEDGTFDSI